MADEVIFYGITNKLQSKLEEYIKISGEPAAFCTKDEEMARYGGKKLFGKYDVFSLDEILKKYPDAHFWVLYSNPIQTKRRLLKYIKPTRLHFFEADLEYRKGCMYLGHFISYRKENFSPCCVTKRCPVVHTYGPIKERLEHWQRYTTELIDYIKKDKINACSTCPHLKYDFYPKTIKLDTICFGSNMPSDVCNFNCVYCFSKEQLNKLKNETDGFSVYEILKQLSEIPEYDTENLTIQFSNGEFCANKYCNEILDILLKTKWKAVFVSNMSIYNEKFAQFIETGRAVSILTSIDAGTPETFKNVRGLDFFNRVVENLKKYPLEKTKLSLKYIFLEGLNDNEEDVNGFYNLVKSLGDKCGYLAFSSDLFKPYTEKMRALALEVVKKAAKDGIKITANSSYLRPEDSEFIYKNYKEALLGMNK